MDGEKRSPEAEQAILEAFGAWAPEELVQRKSSADRARKRALRAPDDAAWHHAEIVERSRAQLQEMVQDGEPYFARIHGRMQDPKGEAFDLDVRVHKYARSESFPVGTVEMLSISHLSPVADLVRNPAEKALRLNVRDTDILRWPELRDGQVRVLECTVEDVEIVENQVTRVAPRYGAIFEDRVKRRLAGSARPALDVLADVLDPEQNLILNDRDPQRRLFILDGPAGTGKTVVAAHRVGVTVPPGRPGLYLTPTVTLRDYVQPALPRLGLETPMARAMAVEDVAKEFWPDWPWEDGLGPASATGEFSVDAWRKSFEKARREAGGAPATSQEWLRIYRSAAKSLTGTSPVTIRPLDRGPAILLAALAGRRWSGARPEWVIVDEVQAVPLTALSALRELSVAGTPFVLAGDLMQQGEGPDLTWEGVCDALGFRSGEVAHLWLRHNYRVPPNIHQAAERIRRSLRPDAPDSQSVPWHPHPGRIHLHHADGEGPYWQGVDDVLRRALDEGVASVALVVLDPRAVEAVTRHLDEKGQPYQELNGQDPYRGGLVVATADLVRGLEFDWVIILDPSSEVLPKTPAGARLLYTCLTRARREVTLIVRTGASSQPSPWLPTLQAAQ